MSKYDFPTQFECQNRILNIKIGFSDECRKMKNEKQKSIQGTANKHFLRTVLLSYDIRRYLYFMMKKKKKMKIPTNEAPQSRGSSLFNFSRKLVFLANDEFPWH